MSRQLHEGRGNAHMTAGRHIAMLGTGLIGDFYTMTLHGGAQPRPRHVVVLAFDRAGRVVPGNAGTCRRRPPSIDEADPHPDIDTVVIGLPNHLHEEAVASAAAAARPCSAPSRSARNADEAQRILDIVEDAGVFAGYLEDLVYTPKTLKAVASVRCGRDRRRDVGALGETHPGRTAPGSGTPSRPAAGRSSTSAATASRSSAASSARTTVPSR